MKPVVTAKEMTEAERAAFACGLSPREAMANAGKALFECAKGFRRVLAVCGCGNNGGDGFACALLMQKAGIEADVWVIGDPARLSEHARFFYEAVKPQIIPKPQKDYDCVIDALFGIGFHGTLSGEAAHAAAWINKQHTYVIAADVPSGLTATTGEAQNAVKANQTVTFAAYKRGLLLAPDLCGQITTADIGIPVSGSVSRIEKDDIRALIPPLCASCHKGTRGYVGVIAGSRGMEGAGALCALSALRSSAGRVSLSVPEECLPFYDGRAPEIMVSPRKDLSDFLSGKDVLILGPGLGRDGEASALVREVLSRARVPLILDADALYSLTEQDLSALSVPVLLTPHIGEAARLFGVCASDLIRDPVSITSEFAQKTGASVLLKSHYNLFVTQKEAVFSSWGCPGMATAGSGDVLAGLCAGAYCLTKDLRSAALLASYLHGTAGKIAQSEKTAYAMTASDIAEAVCEAFRTIL